MCTDFTNLVDPEHVVSKLFEILYVAVADLADDEAALSTGRTPCES